MGGSKRKQQFGVNPKVKVNNKTRSVGHVVTETFRTVREGGHDEIDTISCLEQPETRGSENQSDVGNCGVTLNDMKRGDPQPFLQGVSVMAEMQQDVDGESEEESDPDYIPLEGEGDDDCTDSDEDEDAGGSSCSGYSRIRDDIFRLFLTNFKAITMSQHDMHNLLCKHIQSQADGTPCPSCMATGPHPKTGAGELDVYVITIDCPITVSLCERQCRGCQHIFHPPAPMLGCIPGNVNAFTFKRQAGITAMWFPMKMMAQLDSVMYRGRGRISIHHLTQALVDEWRMGMLTPTVTELPFSVDTMRRQLAFAMQEYGVLATRLDNIAEDLPGWPMGQTNMACGACGDDPHSIHIDGNFKLPARKRDGYAIIHDPPANRRLILDNRDVQRGLGLMEDVLKSKDKSQDEGDEGGLLDTPCSEFKADDMYTQDSRKVRATMVSFVEIAGSVR